MRKISCHYDREEKPKKMLEMMCFMHHLGGGGQQMNQSKDRNENKGELICNGQQSLVPYSEQRGCG